MNIACSAGVFIRFLFLLPCLRLQMFLLLKAHITVKKLSQRLTHPHLRAARIAVPSLSSHGRCRLPGGSDGRSGLAP